MRQKPSTSIVPSALPSIFSNKHWMLLLSKLGSISPIIFANRLQLITLVFIPLNRLEITMPLFCMELQRRSMSSYTSNSGFSVRESYSTSISICFSARLTPVILHWCFLRNSTSSSMRTLLSLAMQLKKIAVSSSVISRQTILTKLEKSFFESSSPSLLRILVKLRFLEWRLILKLDRMKVILVDPYFVKFLLQRSPKIWCKNILSQSYLSASLMTRHPRMKSLTPSLISVGMTILREKISFRNSSRLLGLVMFQGILPTISSQVTTPSDHISHLQLYFSSMRIWGAMQVGVPTMVLRRLLLSRCLANPKSAILTSDSLQMRMFSGLRSRWITPFLTNQPKPLRIWMRQIMAIFSLRRPVLLRNQRRVQSAFSRTMQKLFLVSWTSRNLTMLGHLSFFMILISEQKAFLVYSSFSIIDLATTFIATTSSVPQMMPLQTFEKAPSPNFQFWNNMYLPIFFLALILNLYLSIKQDYLEDQIVTLPISACPTPILLFIIASPSLVRSSLPNIKNLKSDLNLLIIFTFSEPLVCKKRAHLSV